MSENKRFRSSPTDDYNFADIMDGNEWIGICHVDSAEDFCNKLNELNDEKEFYKKTFVKKIRDAFDKTKKEMKEGGF